MRRAGALPRPGVNVFKEQAIMSETAGFSMVEPPATVSFAERLVGSEAFRALFREGMALVEETAAYLDGPGRAEARGMQRSATLAYATESMRLTTRLMQLTSWLLLQRAVNEGELTRAEAETEHRKVKLAPTETESRADLAVLLPDALQALIQRSLRLQQRVVLLDQDLRLSGSAAGAAPAAAANAVQAQLGALSAAFGMR
jgi:regulator of CtrA degradation